LRIEDRKSSHLLYELLLVSERLSDVLPAAFFGVGIEAAPSDEARPTALSPRRAAQAVKLVLKMGEVGHARLVYQDVL
jgi:hypothetical protein